MIYPKYWLKNSDHKSPDFLSVDSLGNPCNKLDGFFFPIFRVDARMQNFNIGKIQNFDKKCHYQRYISINASYQYCLDSLNALEEICSSESKIPWCKIK